MVTDSGAAKWRECAAFPILRTEQPLMVPKLQLLPFREANSVPCVRKS